MTISKQEILDAFHFRHACKQYDSTKKISAEDFEFILETGRLSPSSFGFEPWKFLVIENRKIRELIRDNAWGAADKATDCSHFVVFLVRQENTLKQGSDYTQYIMNDVYHLPKEVVDLRNTFYKDFTEEHIAIANNPTRFYDWACRQSYIALANMMTSAAMIGIDSTPIEGFHVEEMNKMLADAGLFDPNLFKVSVMAAFGYRGMEPFPKARQPMTDVVEWVK